jgi:O-antigen/teichoic acid export membrane protein
VYGKLLKVILKGLSACSKPVRGNGNLYMDVLIDIAEIKKKSLKGIVALTYRTFILQIIAFTATFMLTVLLTPAVFGIFYVVSAVISFLTYFSDIGLAAALIQKKEPLTEDDLRTTFTIQQILVVILSVTVLLCSELIAGFYKLDYQGVWLLRALAVSFFLSSLKTIPSVILERRLDFTSLVFPQIFETLGFYGVAVFLAWRGFGVASFSYAVLVRAIVGLVVIYILCPWRLSFGINKPVAKRLLSFGLPFQVNSILALCKDDLLTIFLGKILTFEQIGYIGWAKKWAEVPLRLILDSIVRVTFPAFSRLQHSKDVLARAIEKTMFGLTATIFPITCGMLFFVSPLVSLIPRYAKWEPALFSFAIFSIASAFSALSVPLTNTLNAIGKIKTTLLLMVMWTVLTWVLTVLFINLFGFNGVSMSLLLITSTVFLVVYLVKRVIDFSFFHTVMHPFIGVALQACLYLIVVGKGPYHWINLGLTALSGVILYGAYMWLVERKKITEIFVSFRAK